MKNASALTTVLENGKTNIFRSGPNLNSRIFKYHTLWVLVQIRVGNSEKVERKEERVDDNPGYISYIVHFVY